MLGSFLCMVTPQFTYHSSDWTFWLFPLVGYMFSCFSHCSDQIPGKEQLTWGRRVETRRVYPGGEARQQKCGAGGHIVFPGREMDANAGVWLDFSFLFSSEPWLREWNPGSRSGVAHLERWIFPVLLDISTITLKETHPEVTKSRRLSRLTIIAVVNSCVQCFYEHVFNRLERIQEWNRCGWF